MKAYGRRYWGDIRSFTTSYLLALVAISPAVLLVFDVAAVFVYVFLLIIGGITIVIVAGVTAVLPSYAYKFLVYLLAVAGYAYALRDAFSFEPAASLPNFNLLLFIQIVFLLALFYSLIERKSMSAAFRRYVGTER